MNSKLKHLRVTFGRELLSKTPPPQLTHTQLEKDLSFLCTETGEVVRLAVRAFVCKNKQNIDNKVKKGRKV